MLPAAARSHYGRLQRLQAVTVASTRRAWRRMRPSGNWQDQYLRDVGPKIAAVAVAAQIAAARDADTYVADVLAELGIGPLTQPGVVVPTALAGVAGDGRPVATLLEGAVAHAGGAYNGGASPADALDSGEKWLDMVAQTLIADANRAAESVAITTRPWVDGYVRMLNPPSCSRCAILAGRFYRWNAGFERHPGCDCVHIPSSEADYTDLRVNPDRYFDSLSEAEQDRIFTHAGAQAIRDGADINQVVNARRGMRKAQVFGHDVLLTTEGTTRRGIAFEALARRGTVESAEEFVTRNTRRGRETRQVTRTRARSPRLMPESIYEIADGDRDEAIRLLKAHGFIHRYQ